MLFLQAQKRRRKKESAKQGKHEVTIRDVDREGKSYDQIASGYMR